MRFPGSKLLSQDLSTETTPFDSIIRHCEDVNLSGYMEIAFGDAEGLLLFYLGEQINVIYRQGNKIFLGAEATLKLRNTAQLKEGKISIYELPLDMAHMLRGLSNRKEMFGQIFASDPLRELLDEAQRGRAHGISRGAHEQRHGDDPSGTRALLHRVLRDRSWRHVRKKRSAQ